MNLSARRAGRTCAWLSVLVGALAFPGCEPDERFLGAQDLGDGTPAGVTGIAALPDGSAILTVSLANLNGLMRVDATGAVVWTKSTSGASFTCAAATSDGGVVAAGTLGAARVVLGAGEPTETTLTIDIAVGQQGVVARYRGDGTLIWARQTTSTGAARAFPTKVATLPDGSSVVTGFLVYGGQVGRVSFPFPGNAGPAVDVRGVSEIFVVRYDPQGTPVWVRRAGARAQDGIQNFPRFPMGLAAAPDGTVTLVGAFETSVAFGEGQTNATVLRASDGVVSYDAFVATFEADGQFRRARRDGGNGFDEASDVVALRDSSVLVTGTYSPGAVFGAGEAGEKVLPASGSGAYIARYAANGALHSVDVIARNAKADAIVVDPDGCAAIVGSYMGTTTFGEGDIGATPRALQGAVDLFVVEYTAGLKFERVTTAPGAGDAYAKRLFSRVGDGTAILGGRFSGTATFGPGEPRAAVLRGDKRAFVARYRVIEGALCGFTRPP